MMHLHTKRYNEHYKLYSTHRAHNNYYVPGLRQMVAAETEGYGCSEAPPSAAEALLHPLPLLLPHPVAHHLEGKVLRQRRVH